MTHSSLFVTYLMIILNITNALVVSKNCIATFDREDEGWAGPNYPEGPNNDLPAQTEKATTPDSEERRGRTKAWENQNY